MALRQGGTLLALLERRDEPELLARHPGDRREREGDVYVIHFEVYPSLAASTNVANKIATSQIALPKAACDLVYATSGYEQSVTNLSQITLATDMVFSDGSSLELATMSGSVTSGFTAALSVAV